MCKENNEHKVIIVRLNKRLIEHFDKIVVEKGLSRSEVIRSLMNEYIEKN
jgi:metal-responsive CopG/Arc/MetJ family transcriptional regulator